MEDAGSLEMLSGGGGAGENEDSGADDGADAQSSERPGSEGLLQPVARFVGVSNKPVNGLTGKKLIRQRSAPASRPAKTVEMCVGNPESHDNKQTGHDLRQKSGERS
jgi:hypothetical protein